MAFLVSLMLIWNGAASHKTWTVDHDHAQILKCVPPSPLAQQQQQRRTAVISLTATLLETAISPIPSTVENIGTVTGEALTSTFSARTTHRLENQRFSISSSWDATSRSTLIVVIGQFVECVTRIATLKQQFRTAQTSQLLTARNWQMVITPTSITAGSTGTALGAWVNMFCVRARNKMEEWKISSTMKRE